MTRANTLKAIPMVILTSVDGTTLRKCRPNNSPSLGRKSMGTRSMMFIRSTQTKMVRPSGAIILFSWWNMLLTLSSTNSTTISTMFCRPPGTPVVGFFATLRKKNKNRKPRTTEKPSVSTLTAQKPIAAASSALWAKPRWPSGCNP